jgi:heptosyltransferase-2
MANIKEIFQYPLFKKTDQHIVQPAKDLIKKNLGVDVVKDPQIGINSNLIKEAVLKFNINSNELNILLGIGGSGPTKRIPSKTFLSVMEKISNFKKSKFFLATGKKDDEQIILNHILNSKFKDKCIPLDSLSITDTLPIIKNCDISICNDSSFSHLSSALGIKTITLMADTPLIYGSYSSSMYPIIPDGETTVSHNTFGKDRINPNKIFDKFLSIIS